MFNPLSEASKRVDSLKPLKWKSSWYSCQPNANIYSKNSGATWWYVKAYKNISWLILSRSREWRDWMKLAEEKLAGSLQRSLISTYRNLHRGSFLSNMRSPSNWVFRSRLLEIAVESNSALKVSPCRLSCWWISWSGQTWICIVILPDI